jgi:hypothetical protein
LQTTDLSSSVIAEGKVARPERKTFDFMNDRLEGNALETINAIIPDFEWRPLGELFS